MQGKKTETEKQKFQLLQQSDWEIKKKSQVLQYFGVYTVIDPNESVCCTVSCKTKINGKTKATLSLQKNQLFQTCDYVDEQ